MNSPVWEEAQKGVWGRAVWLGSQCLYAVAECTSQPVPSLLQALHSDLGSVFPPGKWGCLGVLCEALPGPSVWGENSRKAPEAAAEWGALSSATSRSPESEACGFC